MEAHQKMEVKKKAHIDGGANKFERKQGSKTFHVDQLEDLS